MVSDEIISFVNFHSHGCNLQLKNVFQLGGGGHSAKIWVSSGAWWIQDLKKKRHKIGG